ncbi:MAG: RHS repeat protein, partial [Chloroflexi bacterium]|nr:RHS repeat protein [Chloroflexota bacterium]
MISRLLDNGLTQNFTYNPWGTQGGRLQSLTTAKPDGLGGIVSLQNLSYVYDAAGNVKQITNPLASETNTYGYDPLDRLTSWNLNGTTENYTYDADGNLDIKAGMDLNYNDATHEHAVTHIGGVQKYWHDANGNQTKRIVGADTYDLAYDAENRMVEVKKNNTVMATFVYDGDGRRVESTINGTTTTFVGSHYEVTGGSVTKYYFAGASRIAMRKDGNLTYLLSDHLGSTSITTDANGNSIFEQRYKPWGETRYTTLNATASTKYQFTGQYSHETDFGL